MISTDFGMLGLRVQVTGDVPSLHAAVQNALAAWSSEPVPAGPTRVRLAASLAEDAGGADRALAVHGRRLVLRCPGAEGGGDADAGTGWCRVGSALLADPRWLADEVLEPLLLFLLTRSGRIPLHAAGFLLGGRPVLLAGPGGAGKSSLALEAARSGLPVLGDDTLFLDSAADRVWGLPRSFHLPLAAPSPAAPATAAPAAPGDVGLRGGRWKQRIDPPGFAPGPVNGPAILCVLSSGPPATLSPLEVDEAIAAVMASLEPGFDHFRDELPAPLRRLASGGCWRLSLSPDPATSFAVLLAGLTRAAG